MEDSAEKNPFPISSGIRGCFVIIAIGLLAVLTSCRPETLLVIRDAPTDAIDRRRSSIAHRVFPGRLAMNRFRFETLTTSDRESVAAVLASREGEEPAFVLVSPLMAIGLAEEARRRADTTFIVSGGVVPSAVSSSLNVFGVAADRRDAMRRVGRIAGIRSSAEGETVAALFRGDDDRRLKEQEEFMAGFRETAPPDVEPVVEMVEAGPYGSYSDAFLDAALSAQFLVLFAGSLNQEILVLTDENFTPVVTEDVSASEAWGERIVASVEENPVKRDGAVIATLINLISEVEEPVRSYPSRLIGGKHPESRTLLISSGK